MVKIQINNLTVKYKNKKDITTGLDKLNLLINNGDLLVVLGESGSGKTTLIHCLSGLNEEYEGTILYNNQDISTIPVNELNVGYVTQDYRLYPTLTVFDNIAFPLVNLKINANEIRSRVNEVAKMLKIEFLLTRKPRVLSGGQQQRVSIARAIVKRPSLCLFDEPFSNLDEVTRLEINQLLHHLHSSLNITFVYVTHNIKEAFSLGTKIAILKDGKLIQVGTPNEIYETPKDEYIRCLISSLNTNIEV